MIGKIRANLFRGAWPAVEPWRKFPWDRGPFGVRTWLPQSSQALAIDVFGTIKASPERNRILDGLAESLLVPRRGPWRVYLEWNDPFNDLHEKRRTQIDVVIRNEAAVLFIECKFSEKEAGSCSRPIPRREFGGLASCNGNYQWQADPIRYELFQNCGIEIRDEKCSLTREGILYWRFVGECLIYDADDIYAPCPFAGPTYQIMRNIVSAHVVAQRNTLTPFFFWSTQIIHHCLLQTP